MTVVVIGLNHRTVPLDLLERMTVDDTDLPKFLHDLARRENLSEVVVLSTCNRTEVYAVAERFHGAYGDVRTFLGEIAYLPPAEFADHLYAYYDAEAARQLFRVAAGLDSAVLGESEVLGQVKHAWHRAGEEGVAGPALNMLFRHAIEVGKRARSETSIGRHITSVSQAAVAMADQRLDGLVGRTVLVLGAGDMGEGMVGALARAGAGSVLVANRTYERALTIADRVGGRPIRLADLPDALAEVDVLLTSTGARSIMLEHADFEPVVAARRGEPLLVVDVAVPRDVDPGAADLAGVTLLDMDDLRAFAAAGVRERQREVAAVDEIIDEELGRWGDISSAREAAPLVTALRDRAEGIRTDELERLSRRLDELDDREREAVEALTRAMMAKLLHAPTVRLKEAAGTPRGERLAESLRDLFEL